MEVDAVEIRVLGCLLEKQRTTPDQYPLSLNALRLACNQSTNRDPVVEYDERTIKAALDRMAHRNWTRFASGASSRALKYRHLLDEALGLSDPELAVLAVLMLRGAQTWASSSSARSACIGLARLQRWCRRWKGSRNASLFAGWSGGRVRRRSATNSCSEGAQPKSRRQALRARPRTSRRASRASKQQSRPSARASTRS